MYIDGYVLPVPKSRIEQYRKVASRAGKVWMKHGALQYVECAGDDIDVKAPALSFPKQIRARKGETVVFSFIVFKSRAHRDAVNKKVFKELAAAFSEKDQRSMPFDMKRMAYGGFKPIVDL